MLKSTSSIAAALLVAGTLASGAAHASSNVQWSIGVSFPVVSTVITNVPAPVVVYQPAPQVVYRPAPQVVYRPAPTVVYKPVTQVVYRPVPVGVQQPHRGQKIRVGWDHRQDKHRGPSHRGGLHPHHR